MKLLQGVLVKKLSSNNCNKIIIAIFKAQSKLIAAAKLTIIKYVAQHSHQNQSGIKKVAYRLTNTNGGRREPF